MKKRITKKYIERVCLREIADRSVTLERFEQELAGLVPQVVGYLQEAIIEKTISPREASEALKNIGECLFKQNQVNLTKTKLILEYKEADEPAPPILELAPLETPMSEDEKKESQKMAEQMLAIGATKLYAAE